MDGSMDGWINGSIDGWIKRFSWRSGSRSLQSPAGLECVNNFSTHTAPLIIEPAWAPPSASTE